MPTEDAKESEDFRSYLRAELTRRCQDNPNFSLRAFAKYLAVEPSSLSKILNGKRGLSQSMIDRICDRLNISGDQTNRFKIGEIVGAMPRVSPKLEALKKDHYELVAHWHHYAILELVELPRFQPDLKWIASTLAISEWAVKDALTRLERLGLLDRSTEPWTCTGATTTVGSSVDPKALRSLQHQMLSRAQRALDEVPFDVREQSTMIMKGSPAKLSKAKAMIKNFRRDLMEFMESDVRDCDSVYILSLSLFPTTQPYEKGTNDDV